jgi:DNA primase
MSVIDEVKERLDIVEVISAYVPLQKAGRNYKAVCPFHVEKTPSFVVFPDSQNWHCFGACNEGGDVFSFVMKREGWDFRTALEELARRAGVELRSRTPAQIEAEEETDRLRKLLDTAARYYHHLLRHAPEAEAARAYVARRRLNADTVALFSLGYSLPGWDGARAYLTEQGYSVEELIKAGLLVHKEETDSVYDRFRDRLMIPIRDVQGRVIGFGARTLDPAGVPKYLNSPQTPLFDKGRTLFGLDVARQAIRQQDQVIIVEGYMDVMQAQQAGFANVVAQMGTALTEPQLRQLQRYTQHLILALDPDAAGLQATLRGVEVARETLSDEWEPVFDPRGLVGYEARLGAEIRILRLPAGRDPDTLIREDPHWWMRLVAEAAPVVDFYLQVLTEGRNLTDTKVKAEIVDALLPLLRAVANPVERADYVQKVARMLRLDERAVQSRLDGVSAAAHADQRRQWETTAKPPAPRTPRAIESDMEGHCLAALLQRPSLLWKINRTLHEIELEPLLAQDFQDAGHQAIFTAWQAAWDEAGENGQAVSLANLYEQIPPELQSRLEEMPDWNETMLADEQLVRDVILTVLRLRERHLQRLGRELNILTREAQETGDLRAEAYVTAWKSHTQALLRTQRALAQRWDLEINRE